MKKSILNTDNSQNVSSNTLNVTNSTSNNFLNRMMKSPTNANKPYLEAIEQYKKLCLKTYATLNSNFINTLKQESLNIFLDSYGLKEINVINKIIGSYYYFKQIVLAPFDINRNSNMQRPEKKSSTPLTPSEKQSQEKEKREKEIEKKAKIYTIVQGIAKNLYMTEEVQGFKIINVDLKSELAEFLSEGISTNRTIKSLVVNNCDLSNEAYEILLKGILTHEAIEFLDLCNNNLDDKCGNMIGRIIARQTQRRDQVIWMYGLRNEKPLNNDYTKGLISINLANNQLSDISADNISNALSYDSYIRSINLSSNEMSSEGCKKFIKILRRNVTLLNLDLRGNPGYDSTHSSIHKRLVMKLSKNIKHLHQQYIDKVFSKKEYDYMRKFVNYEFFNVDIPQHIVEMYHHRQEEIKSDHENSTSPKKRSASHSLDERRKKNKEKKIANVKKDEEMFGSLEDEVIDVDNLLDEEEGEEGEEGTQTKIKNVNYSDSEAFPLRSSISNKKAQKMFDKLREQNKNLFNENLQIRKQMLALRAQMIQNQTGANSAQIVNNNNDDINPITQNLSLTGTNHNINISANPRVPPMTGEEGSYEVYYNRVENLLSELTRLMDNMENNIRRNEN